MSNRSTTGNPTSGAGDFTALRNETIRALAAASAAAIRMSPARALAAVSGEIVVRGEMLFDVEPRCTDRDLPIERARNRFTGEARREKGGE